MIVKNESAVIKRCLDSVKHLIDSWIIFDTGSTDNTVEVINTELKKTHGGVIASDWVNFAHNRSEYMEEAFYYRDDIDYILVMDADEILIDKGFDKEKLSADMYNLKYTGDLGYSYPVIFNAKKKWKYEYVTHEIPVADFEGDYVQEELDTLVIDHRHDGGTIGEKYIRDIALIKKELVKDPQNQRYLFYLAQSYFDIMDWENAYITYRLRIKAGGWNEEIAYSWYRAGLCALHLEPAHMVECMMNSYNVIPKAEPLYEIGKYYNSIGDYKSAELFLERAGEIHIPEKGFFIHLPVYNYLIEIELGVTKYWLGDYDWATDANIGAMQDAPEEMCDLVVRNQEFVNKKSETFLQKVTFQTPDYDIIFYDDCSMSMVGTFGGDKGIGGSEMIAIQVFTYIQHNMNVKILFLNNSKIELINNSSNNTDYRHNSYPMEFWRKEKRLLSCRRLIHFRYSNIPLIDCDEVLLWTQDMPGDSYTKQLRALKYFGGEILVPSEFAASLYLGNKVKVLVQNNFVESWGDRYYPVTDKNQYIYASAAIKGLIETIDLWIFIKENYPEFEDAKLVLCNPGYDSNNYKIEDWNKYKISNRGSLGYNAFRISLMESACMFYVNVFPETFGISPYTAHMFGLPVHILCKNGFGALKEIMPAQFITDNEEVFTTDLLRVYSERKNGTFAEVIPANNYEQQIKALANELIGNKNSDINSASE